MGEIGNLYYSRGNSMINLYTKFMAFILVVIVCFGFMILSLHTKHEDRMREMDDDFMAGLLISLDALNEENSVVVSFGDPKPVPEDCTLTTISPAGMEVYECGNM